MIRKIENYILQNKYSNDKEGLFDYNFYQEFSEGYRYILEDKSNKNELFTSNGFDTKLKIGTRDFDSYSFEDIISEVIYNMMRTGSAYILINLDKDQNISISSLRGFIEWIGKDNYIVYGNFMSVTPIRKKINKKFLIVFKLKDLKFKKNYFKNLLKQINRLDITSSSLLKSLPKEFDLEVFANKRNIKSLKITRNIGWDTVNSKSESYILYRKILKDKIKLRMINYIMRKINEGVSKLLNKGYIEYIDTNMRRLNYDELWQQYLNAEISIDELSNKLYQF